MVDLAISDAKNNGLLPHDSVSYLIDETGSEGKAVFDAIEWVAFCNSTAEPSMLSAFVFLLTRVRSLGNDRARAVRVSFVALRLHGLIRCDRQAEAVQNVLSGYQIAQLNPTVGDDALSNKQLYPVALALDRYWPHSLSCRRTRA